MVAGDGSQRGFDIALLITAGSGLALMLATRRFRRELQIRDGFLLVTLVWTVLPAFATLPLLMQLPDLSITDAYFEAMSGLTASGGTALSGLDQLPLPINIWRHLMVWIGGMGILVLVVAILPLLGVGGAQAFKAETTGPLKETKLTPRIADTAKALYVIYFVLSFACFLAYAWAGMSWSDAFMHMCSTLGLGGFSSHDASFGYWNSPLLEGIAVVFMTLAGFSFLLHFTVWRRKSLRPYWNSAEARAFMFTLVASGAGGCSVPAGSERLHRLAKRASLRAVQRRVGGDHDGILEHRLQPVARIRADPDAFSVRLCNVRRLDRRRDQDDARADPVEAGKARDGSHSASALDQSGLHR